MGKVQCFPTHIPIQKLGANGTRLESLFKTLGHNVIAKKVQLSEEAIAAQSQGLEDQMRTRLSGVGPCTNTACSLDGKSSHT